MFQGYVPGVCWIFLVDLGSTYDNLMLLLAKVIPSQRLFLMPSMTLTEQKQIVCSWLVLGCSKRVCCSCEQEMECVLKCSLQIDRMDFGV